MADDGARRWERTTWAVLEFLVALGLAMVVLVGIGGWTSEPFEPYPKACNVVRLEVAAADEKTSLASLEEVVEGCVGEGRGLDDLTGAMRSGVRRDLVFIAAYTALLVWACVRMGGLKRPPFLVAVDRNEMVQSIASVGAWCAVAVALLDAVENAGLWLTAGKLDRLSTLRGFDRHVISATAGASIAKWLLVILPLVMSLLYLVRVAQAVLPSRKVTLDPHVPDRGAARRWAVPNDDGTFSPATNPDPNVGRYGICLSGGGIRSATFALGAMQELESEPATSKWALGKARYLSAVSGGSYLASALQFLAHQRDWGWTPSAERTQSPPVDGVATVTPASDEPLIPRAGPVEDHLRRHSTHLADGAAEWILAAGEILIRAVAGLAILLLSVWIVGVPLGWLYRYVVHGVVDSWPAPGIDVRIAAIVAITVAAFFALRWTGAWVYDLVAARRSRHSSQRAKERWRASNNFAVAALVITTVAIPFLSANVERVVSGAANMLGVGADVPDEEDAYEHLDAVVKAAAETATAAADAGVALGEDARANPTLAAASATTTLAARELGRAIEELDVAIDPRRDGDRAVRGRGLRVSAFDPRDCAKRTPKTDLDLDPVGIYACQAARAAQRAATAAAMAAETAATSGTAKQAAGATKAAAAATTGAAKATAAVRELSDELSGTGAGARRDAPIAWAGWSALVTAIGGLVGKRRMNIANRPGATAKPAKSDRWSRTLGFGGKIEVLAGVATALLLAIAVSDVIVDAWRRGFDGPLDIVVVAPAWKWWVGAIITLLVVGLFLNANSWSLRPFYHRRLWLPYAVTRRGHTAPWRTDTKLSVVGRRDRLGRHPELLVCAAVQTSGRDWAPPGRRALSYVFSATACGGPEIGYMHTAALEDFLGRRRSTVTLFGAMATSGAAFGPAMGRHSKGGLGAVLAVANARLGAWLPNPHHVAQVVRSRGTSGRVRLYSLVGWPRLWYWFMEIIGQYPKEAKLVLATDGGHVENLGLVELLRRRCDRIMCFDASGAGATPATLAEAIVLAREELDVDITLRPPPAPAAPTPAAAKLLDVGTAAADPLLRKTETAEAYAKRLAGRSVLVADIGYPAVGGVAASKGVLVYGTLALDEGEPADWDLLEYAQRNELFPNDGTDRQWFRADTFSAYQQLGRRTAHRMIAAANAANL